MRAVHGEVLNLRVPARLRADLDDAAARAGGKVSPIARKALALGLKAISSIANDDDSRPPPDAPAGVPSLPVAA